jgi:hypothetical protein
MHRNKFVLVPGDDFIWNHDDLIQFLIANQGNPIQINTRDEGMCLASVGVYKLLEYFKFSDVVIRTNNPIEHHSLFKIEIVESHKFFVVQNHGYSQYHYWNKNQIFGCLYNRSIWHRIGLAAEMQSKHNDISLINFRSDPHDINQRQFFEIQKLFINSPQSFKLFSQINHTWPRKIELIDSYTEGNTTDGHTDQLAVFYPEFLVDIVAETFTTGTCFFPTEKTVRPMLLKKPMIVMGPQDFLGHLRQMGFKTFNDFWDEDYDGFAQENRYQKILDLIDHIAQQPIDALVDMYQRMQPILDHNYNLLMSQTYSKTIKKIT